MRKSLCGVQVSTLEATKSPFLSFSLSIFSPSPTDILRDNISEVGGGQFAVISSRFWTGENAFLYLK